MSLHEQVDVETPGVDDIDFETADLFEALRQQRRRFVILLVDRYDTVTLDRLATRIARFENEPPINSHERKRVYTSIYQVHGEKLDDAGLVAYQKREGIFHRTPMTAEGADYIRDAYQRFACFEGAREVLYSR